MVLFGHRIRAVFSVLFWRILWEIIGRSGAIFVLPPFSGSYQLNRSKYQEINSGPIKT
jgi:NitT/TauT family transport system permease protein